MRDRQSGNTWRIQNTDGSESRGVNFELFNVKVETKLSVTSVALQSDAIYRLLVQLGLFSPLLDKIP